MSFELEGDRGIAPPAVVLSPDAIVPGEARLPTARAVTRFFRSEDSEDTTYSSAGNALVTHVAKVSDSDDVIVLKIVIMTIKGHAT